MKDPKWEALYVELNCQLEHLIPSPPRLQCNYQFRVWIRQASMLLESNAEGSSIAVYHHSILSDICHPDHRLRLTPFCNLSLVSYCLMDCLIVRNLWIDMIELRNLKVVIVRISCFSEI